MKKKLEKNLKNPITSEFKQVFKVIKITLMCLLLCNVSINALDAQDQKKITGTILDKGGEPIIGANIAIKGAKEGTASNVNGVFELNVSQGAILVISYIGYVTQELPVGDQTNLQITLLEQSLGLEEVVVIGYGTQKKLTLTGAVTAITSDELITTKSSNVQNALTGKIAGVKVMQRTSEPGVFNNDFSIRGMGKPLIVIDGVPRDNIVRMDDNEIESVSVLKDASAAIYGTRAANGVILITTKKGKKDKKFQFDYTGYVGGQHFLYNAELLDAVEYMQLRNERSINGGGGLEFSQDRMDEYLNGTRKSTDWWNPFVKDFPLQAQHNLSASGGSDKVNFFVNFGFYEQDGLWKHDNSSTYDRFNVRSNVTAELAKGLKADVMLNLMQDARMQQPEGTWRIFRSAWNLLPIDPYYVNDDPNYPYNGNIEYLMDIEKGGYNRFVERLIQTNFSLEYEIPGITGLKAKGMYSYDYKEDENKIFRKPYVTYDRNLNKGGSTYNLIERDYYGYINSMLQLSLSYTKKIGENHNISALALYEESDREGDNFKASRDVTIDAVDQLFAGNSATPKNDQEKGTRDDPRLYHFSNKGFVGRLTYDFASKYIADFSFRYDGSSLFGPGQQWGFFPVGSLGWRLSEESFIKDNTSLSFINNFKLRGSYGIMGDDGNAEYQYLTGYDYPGAPGYVVDGKYTNSVGVRGISNRMLSWIQAKTLDIGLDVDLWNGLLGINFDVFQRDRSGLMSTRIAALPTEVGVSLPQENLNSDQTKGFELTLSHRGKIGNDFSYNLSGNMAFDRTKNKYLERAKSGNEYANWTGNFSNRWQNIMWGVDYLGQYKSFDEIFNSGVIYDYEGNSHMLPGDLILGDWNEDGIIDNGDLHPIEINTPRKPLITGGFTLGANYKGLDLNMVFSGTAMSHIRFTGYRNYYEGPFGENAGTGGAGNGWTVFLDRWHRADEMNPSNNQQWIPGKYPSTYINNGRGHLQRYNSDFWTQNAAFIRLKSLEIGYTVPANLTRKAGVNKARVFVNCFNLLTFTKMTIADPEYQNVDLDDPMMYPLSQTYSVGVNLSF